MLHDFGGEIFSAKQVDRPKPYPDVYLHALRSVGLEPLQALVVEDSPTGIEAAKAAGLRVVGFLGASHITEGHGEQLKAKGADFLASDAEELRKILAAWELV